ncbi:alpha/beta hydrolase [Alteromonas sediminis]|uniref:Alpha/beta hydrolase n=1 Tax=Alteromonas sediminis TaxID=2259342 RepID=A0A3N5XZK4_9ALTE|nr:alpha/beta hydrolase [Alteromonas sediminis]RPJ66532.1 alpha/beta hydrolase [Alteromonas sediminis]
MKKSRLLCLCGLLSLMVGCGSATKPDTSLPPEQGDNPPTSVRNTLNGLQYTLAMPKGGLKQGKAYKLLLAFHGSGGTDSGMQNMARFEQLSDDFLVVYPKSQEVEWDEGCECNIAHRLGAKDVERITQLIDELHNTYTLLPNENYAVGFSQGGLFSQNMLCKHSALFRAVVTVAAPMSEQLHANCHVNTPTHYMLIQGTRDQVLPYYGRKDNNFGLISAPEAVQFFAYQNMQAPEYSEQVISSRVTEAVYQQGDMVNKLVSIEGGEHSWSFEGYRTSEQVLTFFNQSSAYPLPDSSSLYSVGSDYYHVRTLGDSTEKGDIVILSGANRFFHSDSAWAALIQPLLAEHARVHVIDRLGNAWSSNTDAPSFSRFATDLPVLLKQLGSKQVTFLTFANGNLAALMYLNQDNPDINVKGMVWVDPDILLPHAVAQYQSGAVAGLRKYRDEYIAHVAEGNWTTKSADRIAIERQEIAALIPPHRQPTMDWAYYDKVTALRVNLTHQLVRIKEMMHYHDDLNTALNMQHQITVPISVIDSDFERLDIAQASDEVRPRLVKWQQQGTQWSKDITYQTGGQYYPLENASHQVLFEHPDVVLRAVLAMTNNDNN